MLHEPRGAVRALDPDRREQRPRVHECHRLGLVQVAHGVKIGRDVLLAAQVGIAGSSTLEDRVTLAGQVPNSMDRLKAEEVARTVEGVVSVNNNLQVENPERM